VHASEPPAALSACDDAKEREAGKEGGREGGRDEREGGMKGREGREGGSEGTEGGREGELRRGRRAHQPCTSTTYVQQRLVNLAMYM